MSVHGGDIWHLDGWTPDQILDFSSNINPLGVPPSVQALLARPELAMRYPDVEYRDLRAGLAAWVGLSPDHVAVGNGASELIRELLIVLQPRRVMVPSPGFAEYARAARSLGIEVVLHRLDPAAGFRLDPEVFAADLRALKPDLVFLCNPNNPTAAQADLATMKGLFDQCEAVGAWLVVDETFIELSRLGTAASLVPLVKPAAPLIVLRALTKVFALPGLRLGYLACEPPTAERIRASLVPWSVNGFAAQAGGVFEAEKDYLERTALWISEEPDWLYGHLAGIGTPDLDRVWKPDTNFILCRLRPPSTAAGLKEALLTRGILIRDCGNFPGLDPGYFRVAVRDRRSNERLVQEIRTLLICGHSWGT